MPLELSTPADLRRAMEKTLGWSTGVGLFPVRHHSPTCARHLDRWLRKFKPKAVLIEGPAVYNGSIDVLADPEHVCPFALVAIARGGGSSRDVLGRAYYPFCDYSPELVAMRTAKAIGAEVRFIDLVYGERGRKDLDDDDDADSRSDDPEAVPDLEQPERLGSAEDGPLARSNFTKQLIARSGCRDFDEVWEALFEQAGWAQTPEEWAVSVASYSALSRAGYRRDELEAEDTIERERFMARHIEEAKKEHSRIAVITGAFHTVALRETEPSAPKKKSAKDGLTTEVFLAPYTFPRLDALLGYESGMSGPQFYQYVWEAQRDPDPFGLAAQRVLVEASRLARRDGEVLGTADAIAALAFARQLASFRGRPHVGRAEVIEAARTCFVKGDTSMIGRRVEGALTEAMRGTKVGKLGASAGQSPLIGDFTRKLKELRLPLEHGRPTPVECEIWKSDLHLEKSRFFHQLTLLEVPFAKKVRGPDLVTGEDLHLMVEHWEVQYVPEVDTRLVEVSHLGSTIEDVAAALLVKATLESEGHSDALSTHLLRALVMGLHKPASRLLTRLGAAMFTDDDAISLLGAGSRLRTVLRGRERLEASLVAGLPSLAKQAFVQGTLRLERLAGVSPDRIDHVLEVLSVLLDVALTDPSIAPPRDLLLDHARAARADARSRAPAVLGAMEGFLLQLGEGSLESLGESLRNLARGKSRVDGVGAYLEGVLSVARQALIGGSPLLDALLDHIQSSEWNDFMASLPALRRALTRLSPRETEAVAERAAAMFGISRTEATALLEAPPEMIAKLGDWERSFTSEVDAWSKRRQP